MSLRVCFVALHALPAVRPSADRPVGGTETRAWTFARGLAQLPETEVTLVVRGEPAMREFTEGNVRILPRHDRLYSLRDSVGHCLEKRSGFPYLRLKRWSGHLLWQLPVLAATRPFGGVFRDPQQPEPFFERIDADVFCTFGVQANSARVIASAHAVGKPAVLMIGSDGDLDERFTAGSNYVSPYGDVGHICDFVLQNADAIVAQTPRQQQMLKNRFSRESTVVANPFDLDDWDARSTAELPSELRGLDRYALWVGRAELLHKRPQVLLEVARHCPEVRFLMVMNQKDPAVEQQIRHECPSNVQIVRAVPFDLMPALFARSALFVSTSALEGFPNVFLQSAASRVPIASLEVGEEFLTASQGGEFCAGDLDKLAIAIHRFWNIANPTSVQGDPSRDYVKTHHSLGQQVQALRRLLALQVRSASHTPVASHIARR